MLKEHDMKNMMESPQCLDYGGQLNYDICYPSQKAILEQTAAVVEQIQAKSVFVASDSNFMIDELKEKCKVHGLVGHSPCIVIQMKIASVH